MVPSDSVTYKLIINYIPTFLLPNIMPCKEPFTDMLNLPFRFLAHFVDNNRLVTLQGLTNNFAEDPLPSFLDTRVVDHVASWRFGDSGFAEQ